METDQRLGILVTGDPLTLEAISHEGKTQMSLFLRLLAHPRAREIWRGCPKQVANLETKV